jgi:hypothetical protein
MDEENSRSGKFVDAEGRTEYWWNGFNYECVLPEELIDMELSALEQRRAHDGVHDKN